MEEQIKLNPYVMPGIPYGMEIHPPRKKRLTEAIAEAWNIPEDKVLGCTEIINKIHPSPYSARGQRIVVPGERHIPFVNARKFYFYVMIEIKHYPWSDMRKITGRKISAMKYACEKARQHIELEKDYGTRASYVLDLIAKDLIIFPKPNITIEANVTVIEGGGVNENPPNLPLSGQDSTSPDTNKPTSENRIGTVEGIARDSGQQG